MNTQVNADNSIMDGDEWQAMSEEHQALQLAAESKLVAKCEAAYLAQWLRECYANDYQQDKP